jgi:hypothetical protein
MFPGREVNLKLYKRYKLPVYEAGGFSSSNRIL